MTHVSVIWYHVCRKFNLGKFRFHIRKNMSFISRSYTLSLVCLSFCLFLSTTMSYSHTQTDTHRQTHSYRHSFPSHSHFYYLFHLQANTLTLSISTPLLSSHLTPYSLHTHKHTQTHTFIYDLCYIEPEDI